MKKILLIILVIILIGGIVFYSSKKDVQENNIEDEKEVTQINEIESNIVENMNKEENENNIISENNEIKDENVESNSKEQSVTYTIENNKNEEAEKRTPPKGDIEKNKKYACTSNKKCGIKFTEGEKFEFDLGSGNSISGTYKIENNSIVCTALNENTSDGDRGIAGSLVFKVIDEKLKLINISIKGNSVKLNEETGIKINLEYTK